MKWIWASWLLLLVGTFAALEGFALYDHTTTLIPIRLGSNGRVPAVAFHCGIFGRLSLLSFLVGRHRAVRAGQKGKLKMNTQEKLNLLKQFLTLIGGLAVGAGILSSTQETHLISDLMTIVGASGAVISAGSIVWSAYSHWNMKKVPEKATAILLPGPPPVIGRVLDLAPMTGKVPVVG